MAKKKDEDAGLAMVSRRLPVHLWQRFQALGASMRPRVSDTALLEEAISEYLERHEPKTKKGEK